MIPTPRSRSSRRLAAPRHVSQAVWAGKRITWSLCVLAAGACGSEAASNPEASPGCIGGKCDGVESEDVACWIDIERESGAVQLEFHSVRCSVPSTVGGAPLRFVEVGLQQLPPGVHTVRSFGGTDPEAEYPVEVPVGGYSFEGILAGLPAPFRAQQTLRFRRASDATAARPAVVETPFEVWTLDLETELEFDQIQIPERTLTLRGFDPSQLTGGAAGLTIVRGRTVRAFVAVDRRATTLDGTLLINDGRVTFTGPGRYRIATAGAERLGDVGSGESPSPIDGGPPDAGPPGVGEPDAGDAGEPDAGEPDAGEPDAGPVCGADGQPRCDGTGDCAEGHRLERSTGLCRRCGSHEQTYCQDPAGNRFCDDGHRYDRQSARCYSCGSHEQTFCIDPNGNRFCDDGHRYDRQSARCYSCGSHEQTFCQDRSGNRFCNDGHRYSSTDLTCYVCGSHGQTFCQDPSGNRFCDDGHRYDRQSARCVRE